MRTLLLPIFFSILTPALTLAPSVAAQPDGANALVGETNTAYYSFLRPGEVPMEVFVLGEVRVPGVYVVGLGTSLDQLLALAAGVPPGAGQEHIERDVRVRLYHAAGGNRVLAYEESLHRVLAGSPPLPPLEDRDVVVVDVQLPPSTWFTLDNTLRLFSVLTSLFLLIERVVR